MANSETVVPLPLQRRPFALQRIRIAAAVYLLSAIASAAEIHPTRDTVATRTSASAAPAATITRGSSSRRRGWRRSQPFVGTESSNLRRMGALFRARGGGATVEDEGATLFVDVKAASDDTFPDSDDVLNDDATVEAEPPARNLTFGATNPNDGSADDPDGIPSRFLLMKKGDRDEAREAFEAHVEWRREFGVDAMLGRPHPGYDVCKAMVPHYFAGRDPHGNVIFVQRPALLDFELMRKNNSTIDDLLLHYVYVIEYCWHIHHPGPPEGIMTNVLDMKGFSFRHMKNQEYIGFGKRFVNMMSLNYPGRSYKTLIINAPKWFHALYKIFKPLLRESTREKIVILKPGKKQDKALKLYLGDSLPTDLVPEDPDTQEAIHEPGMRYFLPVEEIEQCKPGPNSLVEFHMRQFCIEQLELHNETLQEVI